MKLSSEQFQSVYERWSALNALPEADWDDETFDDHAAAEQALLRHRPVTLNQALAILRVLEHSLSDSQRLDGLDRAAVARLRCALPVLATVQPV